MKYKVDVYLEKEDREEILNQIKRGLEYDEKIVDEDKLVNYMTQYLLDDALGKIYDNGLLDDIVEWQMKDVGVLNGVFLEEGFIEKMEME